VLNAFNVTATTVVGVPTVPAVPTAALVLASGDAGKATKMPIANDTKANDRPSIIIVEVLGYGGKDPSDEKGDTNAPQCDSEACRQKDHRTQDLRSPSQVLGAGEIADEQAFNLIAHGTTRSTKAC
jgi:hypothetical protein